MYRTSVLLIVTRRSLMNYRIFSKQSNCSPSDFLSFPLLFYSPLWLNFFFSVVLFAFDLLFLFLLAFFYDRIIFYRLLFKKLIYWWLPFEIYWPCCIVTQLGDCLVVLSLDIPRADYCLLSADYSSLIDESCNTVVFLMVAADLAHRLPTNGCWDLLHESQGQLVIRVSFIMLQWRPLN